MATRKDARNLTPTEKADFVRAVRELKNRIYQPTGRNVYDQFVLWHAQAGRLPTTLPGEPNLATYRNAAHRGPVFHPWHREMLRRFELELQGAINNPNLGIPYWNWSRDSANPGGAAIWAGDFMGGNGFSSAGWRVRTGPFREGQWTIVDADGNNLGPLRRQFGSSQAFPTSAGVGTAIGETPYDNPQWNRDSSPSHRNRLEGSLNTPLHNSVHNWIGQTMAQVLLSPNDPVFYLHHCNVDRLWALWQSRNLNQVYVPASGGPPRHNLNDPMYIWEVPPASVLNITALGYTYG